MSLYKEKILKKVYIVSGLDEEDGDSTLNDWRFQNAGHDIREYIREMDWDEDLIYEVDLGSYLKLIALTNQIGGKYPTLWCIRFDRFKDRHYVDDILSLKDPEKIRKRIMSFGTEYILDKNL